MNNVNIDEWQADTKSFAFGQKPDRAVLFVAANDA
jgi:hypothetical protein